MNSSILVIYTGGTIGMVKSENGSYVPFSLVSLTSYLPDLKTFGSEVKLLSFDEPLDSSHVGPAEWQQIAKIIIENNEAFDAFVVLHGTDTMAYTSSALGFMLQGLGKPVVLTGSQIPISEEGTDAIDNFMNALKVAKDGIATEVCVWFNKMLLRGVACTKVDTASFDGFQSPNQEPLAFLEKEIKYNKNVKFESPSDFEFKTNSLSNVAVVPLIPGLESWFNPLSLLESNVQGIVFKVFGSGTVPFKEGDIIFKGLKKLQEKGVIMMAVSQCLKGEVEIGKYEASSVMNNLGVISGKSITTESAVTKMMVGIANVENPKDYILQNQVGEF